MNTTEFQKLRNNIWKNYIGAFLGGIGYFYNTIEILYYRHFALSFQQIGWLFGLSSLILLIFEIPSGAFGDLYGKKKTLIISAILLASSSLIISITSSFWTFAIGFILWGLAAAFNSGSGAALFYDSLQSLHREKEYVKHMGRIDAIFISLDILSGFAGPLLFIIFVRIPYFISIIGNLLLLVVYLNLYEPRETVPLKGMGFWQLSSEQMKKSMRTAIHNQSFRIITIFTVIFFTLEAILNNIVNQPFMREELGFSLGLIALLSLIHNPFQVSIVLFSGKLERKLGSFNSLILIIVLSSGLIVGMIFYFNPILLGVLWGIAGGAWSYAYVIKDKFILHHVPEDQRATLLSANSMFNSFTKLLILPIFGLLLDLTSFLIGLFAILVAYMCLGVIISLFKKKID